MTDSQEWVGVDESFAANSERQSACDAPAGLFSYGGVSSGLVRGFA